MDQTQGVEILQQDACWVDEGQAGEYESRMDVALYKDWNMQGEKPNKNQLTIDESVRDGRGWLSDFRLHVKGQVQTWIHLTWNRT